MYNATNPEGIPTAESTLSGKKREDTLKRFRVAAIFWGIGLILFVVSCFIIHAHPQPFPFDLAVTQALTPLQDVRWANSILQIPGMIGDTISAAAALSALFVVLMLTGEFRRRRGKSVVLWFEAAIFLAVFVPLSTGIKFPAFLPGIPNIRWSFMGSSCS